MTSAEEIQSQKGLFPIVGVGCSAGGLEALEQFFFNLPVKSPICCVVIQHIDAKHVSYLAEILARQTSMGVVEAKNGSKLQIGCVYTIPPNFFIEIENGLLKLSQRAPGAFLPINAFFNSLAAEYEERAVGIILSGGGSDGAEGLQSIKQAGGMTFCQDRQSSKFTSMPESAVATGSVDFILDPKAIAEQLGSLLTNGFWKRASDEKPDKTDEADVQTILKEVHRTTGVDFSSYKSPTVSRRIARRMAIKKADTLAEYYKALKSDQEEAKALSQDLLIQVTSFFRDGDVFEQLKKKILPRLTENRTATDPLRIWIAGCASGQEAYSLLIALSEYMSDTGLFFPVQVFGTDINDQAIIRARTGTYPESAVGNLSPERLRRFFTKSSLGYTISKSLRDYCIFAKHNVTSDPPFAKLDLVSCQNVLIYFNSPLQRRVLSIFHYALKTLGVLVLGKAEALGASSDLYAPLEQGGRAFVKTPVRNRLYFDFAGIYSAAERAMIPETSMSTSNVSKGSQIQREADRLLLAEFAPPGVLLNEKLEVIQFRGHTGPFLEHSPGSATLELLKMLRPGLISEVLSTFKKVQDSDQPSRTENIKVSVHGQNTVVAIEMMPLKTVNLKEHFYLLLFEDMQSPTHELLERRRLTNKLHDDSLGDPDNLTAIRIELKATKDYLQSVNEEKEAANEELRAANEEITSSNEELQSTNEELHSAKEELQSTNEELTTVNDELQSRNKELSGLNNDMTNLFSSLDVAVVMLNKELRIRKYTPMAEKFLNLTSADIGRLMSDIRRPIEIKDFDKILLETLRSMHSSQLEAQDEMGRWFSVQVRPYRTLDDRIDGVVLLFGDIDEMKVSLNYAEAIEETIGQPLLVLSGDLKVRKANAQFYKLFATTPKEVEGRVLYELGKGEFNNDKFKVLLEEVLPKNKTFSDFEITLPVPKLGNKSFRLNGHRLVHRDLKTDTIVIAFEIMP